MGSVTKAAGGVAAVLLVQAGMTAAASAAAQPIAFVPCSTSRLVSAIASANAVGGRTLRLAPRCNYRLTAPVEFGNGPDGLPIIRGHITLTGGPSTRIDRAAASAFRLIEVAPGGTLGVRNIFLRGGDSAGTGGAIRNSGGTVELSRTTVEGNRARSFGGGLDNAGSGRMVIDSSLIVDNTAAVNGGGIFNDGFLLVTSSRLTDNRAAGRGGGLRDAGDGLANIVRSTFDHNVAGTLGGGISIDSPSQLGLTRSLVERNRAANGGGVAAEPGTTLTQNGSIIRVNVPNNCVGAGCV